MTDATGQSAHLLASTVVWRLVAVMLVALVSGVAAFYWSYGNTNRAAQAREMATTVKHFRIRLDEIDRSWRLNAQNLRTQLSQARLLDTVGEWQVRLTAHLAGFGDGLGVSHLLLLDPAGKLLFDYQPGEQAAPVLPQGLGGEAAWLFDPSDATVYRMFTLPVLVRERPGHRLVLLVAIDNALLAANVFPGVESFLLWDGKVVASSRGNDPLGRPAAMLAVPDLDHQAADLPWIDAEGAPTVLLRQEFRSPVPLRDAMLTYALSGALLALLGWLVLGGWLARLAARLDFLKRVADSFRTGDDVAVRQALGELEARLAQPAGRDEVGGLAAALADSLRSRLAAEEAMRASEALFAALFHDAPLPLALAEADDGTVLDINEAWLELFGFARAEVVGRRAVELNIYPDPATRAGLVAAVTSAGEARRYEAVMARKDGEHRLCQLSSRLMDLRGKPTMLTGIIDVTEQRRAQEQVEQLNETLERRVAERTAELANALDNLKTAQESIIHTEKLAALGSLVAGIAHELNTPIGNAVMLASTLRDRLMELKQLLESDGLRRSALEKFIGAGDEASDLLLKNLERAGALVSSFKQVSADQTSEQRRRFNLATSIGEIVAMLSPTLRRTPHRLEIDIDGDIEMDSYPGPLAQVVTNLVNNAILHGFEGVGAGRMRLSARPLSEDTVGIVFSDNGRGIPADHQKRIFEPFFTTKLGHGGSGLGLNIVFNLVTKVMGGTVDVESLPGQGTSFRLTLPRTAPRQ